MPKMERNGEREKERDVGCWVGDIKGELSFYRVKEMKMERERRESGS